MFAKTYLKLNFLLFFIYIMLTKYIVDPSATTTTNTVGLYFYSPLNNFEQLIVPNKNLSDFKKMQQTKIIIHGFISNRFHISIEPLKNAYLLSGNVNLIIADWGKLAYTNTYENARKLTEHVAGEISIILTSLLNSKLINYDNLHIIGHSLGAHIAGIVGRRFSGKIARITGLDPAGPLYQKSSVDAISQNDGKLVDIIHSCGYILGEIWQSGHIDFYPNSGLPFQPGCQLQDVTKFFSCSHFRAVSYFAESILIRDSFMAYKCEFNNIIRNTTNCVANNKDSIFMGEYLNQISFGSFYLKTNEISPYGKGNLFPPFILDKNTTLNNLNPIVNFI